MPPHFQNQSVGNGRRAAAPYFEPLEVRELPATFAPAYVAAPASGAGPASYSPAQVRHAYGFDEVSFNGVAGDGTGQTIAVVDAYDDPSIASDLHHFDLAFGLPDPVLTKVNESGGASLPPASAVWAPEISLDVEWAHAIAPGARILLVEANSNGNADLFAAVALAAREPGVSVVSMSWGGAEFSSEAAYDGTFTTPAGHAGVTFVAAAGDEGAPTGYPAASPNVLAVGGTSLYLGAGGSWAGETAWSRGGGGPSGYEARPAYQQGTVPAGVASRATPDVAYDADPNTGFAIYDSYNFSAATPWAVYGGTSAGAPQWAALVAIADQGRALNRLPSLDGPGQTLPALYQLPAGDFHDVTAGFSTGTPNYWAGPGYDLVTGRGTPLANLVIAGLVGYGAAPTFAAPSWLSLGGQGNTVAGGGNADGSQQVFAAGLDGALWVRTLSAGGTWGGWVSLGGQVNGLAVAANAYGYQDVFTIGDDGAVWVRRETAAGQWSAWTSLGGTCTSLAVGTNADGSEQVFALGTGGALWTRTGTATGQWSGWVGLGGVGQSLAVTRNSRGLLDAFVIGADGAVWTRSQTAAGQWSAWASLGGVCLSLAVGTNADGSEQVYALDAAGTLWRRTGTATGQWSGWVGLGGVGQSLAVTRNSRGLLDAFVIGADGAAWTRSQTAAGQWSAWASLGGLSDSLAVTSDAFGRQTVFTAGAYGSLARRTQASAGSWI